MYGMSTGEKSSLALAPLERPTKRFTSRMEKNVSSKLLLGTPMLLNTPLSFAAVFLEVQPFQHTQQAFRKDSLPDR